MQRDGEREREREICEGKRRDWGQREREREGEHGKREGERMDVYNIEREFKEKDRAGEMGAY